VKIETGGFGETATEWAAGRGLALAWASSGAG
jgi:hypothetical protein